MTWFPLGVVGFLCASCALVGCSASCPVEPVYAEYSLDPGGNPESIDCFYECSRTKDRASREACFAACDGVVVWTTAEPCRAGSLALCRGYSLVDPTARATCEAEEDDASIFFDLLELAADVATSSHGDSNDSSESNGRSKHLARSSERKPSRSAWGEKSSSGPSPAAKIGTKSKLRKD